VADSVWRHTKHAKHNTYIILNQEASDYWGGDYWCLQRGKVAIRAAFLRSHRQTPTGEVVKVKKKSLEKGACTASMSVLLYSSHALHCRSNFFLIYVANVL
jgi:hypothetical protein